ncbi:serine/threonine-protein kinase EDR1-like isoform X2 [Magnolia sinica]|uniref:serine/threonine-protein kinase EDR1-like isoform X2 n=1 Tax=Magnolia sinica TaxID=86752 RepID=UPI002657CEA5|nr:serine/threonine-protein kinase EDR1-like isoform X2 [Magnolia sinica]
MEETPGDAGLLEPGPSNASWLPSGFMEKLKSVSLVSQEDTLNIRESACNLEQDELSSQTASQILWATGSFSGPIPNGFYSVIPEKRIKELFHNIPSPDELCSLGVEGSRADIILVDAEKDKKLSMLKQLIVTLVKGLNSNPASMIKKIAGLVFDFYGRSNSELSLAKAPLEEIAPASEVRGVQLLGQIRHASCRPRAILFKVLADAVGLESKLMVGLPSDGAFECTGSYRHMSVAVVLKSVELLVDLMRFPGQLIPPSTKAIFMSHISAAGESDSAENDSCDSPLEPNSPLWALSDKLSGDGNCGSEQDENLQSLYQWKVEALLNVSGPSFKSILQPAAFVEGKSSLSNGEPNMANAVWRRNRRKAIADQRAAGSSPEHPLFRAHGRSMLSSAGDRKSFREYMDDMAVSRSVGASTSENRRTRRRSISITPEIGDDIVRAVRAMNETLKQHRLLKEQGDDGSGFYFANDQNNCTDPSKTVSNFHQDGRGEISSERSAAYNLFMEQRNSKEKAISLPSSPNEFRGQAHGRSGPSAFLRTVDLVSTWKKVLQSSSFLNKPLSPFQEWNIDFSELTIGTRVGIGFFGEVFRGVWNGTDVAVKIFLEQELTAENMEDFCNEIFILSRLRHPNVILFLGACTTPPHLSMVTEYMEMGSLYYLIHMSGQKKISWRRRLKMLRDICRGLMCMHRMKIVHRDLKSANCLVNKHWTVKIGDFGLSRVMTEVPMRDSSSAGTPEWMAPELIRKEPFTEKCDVFSFGVIMWELCTLSRPWEGVPSVQVVHAVANEGSRLEIPEGPMGKLISDCWAQPDERPSCEEILSRLLDCEYTIC